MPAALKSVVPPRIPGLITGPNTEDINLWVRKIWADIGDLDDFVLWPTDVVVAHWERTTLPGSRLLAAAATKREDRFQGKVGMVLKLGSNAFVDAPDAQFYGFTATVGDWVVYKNTDGREFDIVKTGSVTKTIARALKDGEIFMKVARPDRVW